MYDDLDELLEEAYLEGYYDSIDDYDDYYESNMSPGRIKKLRARNKAKKEHIMQRALDNIGFVQTGIDDSGNKIGVSQMGDGPKIPTAIIKSNTSKRRRYNNYDYNSTHPFCYTSRVDKSNNLSIDGGKLLLDETILKSKGSDVASAHEYGHGYDYMKDGKKNRPHSDTYVQNIIDIRNKAGFKPKFSNEHDRLPNEMYADAFAIKNTKGQNNANRLRKSLNDMERRFGANTYRASQLAMTPYHNELRKIDRKINMLERLQHKTPEFKAELQTLKNDRRVLTGSISSKKLHFEPRNERDERVQSLRATHDLFNGTSKNINSQLRLSKDYANQMNLQRSNIGNSLSQSNIIKKIK